MKVHRHSEKEFPLEFKVAWRLRGRGPVLMSISRRGLAVERVGDFPETKSAAESSFTGSTLRRSARLPQHQEAGHEQRHPGQ